VVADVWVGYENKNFSFVCNVKGVEPEDLSCGAHLLSNGYLIFKELDANA